MIRGLGPVFDLAETFVDIGGSFPDGLFKQLRTHEVRTGAGG